MCTLTILSSVVCVSMVEGMSVVVNVILNRGSVGRVPVFGLRWCGWCRSAVGKEIRPGSGGVGWSYVCVSCESRLFV